MSGVRRRTDAPALQGLLAVAAHGRGGERDDERLILRRHVLADEPERADAVEDRCSRQPPSRGPLRRTHLEIHQNGLRIDLQGLLEPDAAVLGKLDVAVTETLQDLAGHLLIDKIVFDDCTGQQSSS